ncbi:tetratricopeptide repeat protein [Foetidibacter luteolus]|uniref:tetratricopeptide repeat protein n=1 Tax=Foetidibacter luteolus TaxID=2608880 RepID=UPI00129BF259|nr:tetratricopeptide repeat protein [Foetidibacter luteolus]
MMLQLKYSNRTLHTVAAAFIKSSSPRVWLTEINNWGVSVKELDCYIMPESIRSVKAAGLLVTFNNTALLEGLVIPDGYGLIAGKLFIPVNASLYPQVNEEELSKLLAWEYQFFHPSIGLVGFDKKDRFDFGSLALLTQEKENDWSFAHPGIERKPPLQQVQVKQPTVQELMEELKKDIHTRPLDEMPGKKGTVAQTVDKALDKVKWGLFKTILAAANGIQNVSGTHNNDQENDRPGGLERLQQWLGENLQEIEKRRNEELNRLVKLFDKDTDEALQYALPLNSPYLNRGNAQKTSALTRRPTNFNPGGLGGGGAVDGWDVGGYYHSLRTRYLDAAQKEIKRKDFKKAAYVYAHLLGDYSGAANALEQGKLYREAAALYKDHLKNNVAAAECLERGGLYSEAIELYDKLLRHEKVGDLYSILQQKDNANRYYQETVASKISAHDYLDASRVMMKKMQQPEEAKQLLLTGWKENCQSEHCLKKYFDLVNETEENNTFQKVKDVYEQHTPPVKQELFLHVLHHVSQTNKADKERTLYQDIAYNIISDETAKGNSSIVHKLKNFITTDRLISSDCSRYVTNTRDNTEQPTSNNVLQLDQSIRWQKAVSHRNQFLAVGTKDNLLHLARGNWYGNIEYYTWDNPVQPHVRFTFIHSPYYSKHILLHASDGLPVTRKTLDKNKYFGDSLTVYCPVWLHKEPAKFIITEDNELCRLETSSDTMTLHYYTIEGQLKRSLNCNIENEVQISSSHVNPLMACFNDYYYTYRDKQFFSISKKGEVKAVHFDTGIRLFGASEDATSFSIIISTNKGLVFCRPKDGSLNVQGEPFASHLIPGQVLFFPGKKFLVVEKHKAVLFSIEANTPISQREYATTAPIATAIHANRNQFALVEQTGRIMIYTIE